MANLNSDAGLIVLAFFFPYVSVAVKYGIGPEFFLNLLLTMIGFIPGVIHAILLVAEYEGDGMVYRAAKSSTRVKARKQKRVASVQFDDENLVTMMGDSPETVTEEAAVTAREYPERPNINSTIIEEATETSNDDDKAVDLTAKPHIPTVNDQADLLYSTYTY